jgi:hypothetical protein
VAGDSFHAFSSKSNIVGRCCKPQNASFYIFLNVSAPISNRICLCGFNFCNVRRTHNAIKGRFMEGKDNKTTQQRNRSEMLSEEELLDKASHRKNGSYKSTAH